AASAVASIAGGALVSAFPGRVVVFGVAASGLQMLFLASGALRLCAAALALRIEESGARTVRTLGRLAFRAVRPLRTRAAACVDDAGPATSAA
ncbi:MAG TPA: hypothetical protein VM691_02460, partial [Myxococcales bacterium]|nr:hypothetical protein [Myxococcales bacterium]